jgi:hypothetical protein
VRQLYRERYFDFNVKHFHGKLSEEHGVRISRLLLGAVLHKFSAARAIFQSACLSRGHMPSRCGTIARRGTRLTEATRETATPRLIEV